MPGRPEGTDGGYDAVDPVVDANAWEEFTAWRPSSGASTAPQTDHGAWRGGDQVDRGGYGWGVGRSRRSDRGTGPANAAAGADAGRQAEQPERRGSWWTEDQPAVYGDGQRVESTRATGGMLGGRTPAGTTGHIESIETGLFAPKINVRFDNGYTETVSPEDIKPKGWL